MKKVFILVDQMYMYGGIETLVAKKANYWTSQFNYDVTIIATEQYDKPLAYDLNTLVKIHDINVNYNRNKSYFSVENLFKLIKNLFKLQSLIFKERPDIIIVASHIPITYILPFLIRKRKIVKEYHFSKYQVRHSSFKQKMMNWIDGLYDKIVVLSKEEATFYKTSNVEVIPNPIEKIIETSLNNKLKQNQFVFIGRLVPVKQIEVLLFIWESFIQKYPNWKLIIVGPTNDSDYANEMTQLVKIKKMETSVYFAGKSNKVDEYLTSCKALLLTSKQECFPMVIIEAMGSATPVISFDCPTGPRNIISHLKDGILVENGNCSQFVEEMCTFVKSIELQNVMAKNALESAKKFQMHLIMKEWKLKIFET